MDNKLVLRVFSKAVRNMYYFSKMDIKTLLRVFSKSVRRMYYFSTSFPDLIRINFGFDARGVTKSKIKHTVFSPSIQQARAAEHHLSYINIKEWTLLAEKIAPQKGRAVLDIGANIGYSSLLFREVMPGIDIYAFEPSPFNLKYLKKNLKGTNINIETIGLGAQEKNANLSLPEYAAAKKGDHVRNTGRLSVYGEKSENSEYIKIVTLDAWRETNLDSKIAFIKIDVEGAELDVLRGGENTLKNDRPILMIELNKTTMELAGWGLQQLIQFLKSVNYSISIEKDLSNIIESKELDTLNLVQRITDVWLIPGH